MHLRLPTAFFAILDGVYLSARIMLISYGIIEVSTVAIQLTAAHGPAAFVETAR